MSPGPEEPAYFVEHDGRVFLVHRQGEWRLPARADVPFPIREKRGVQVRGQPVVFAAPEALEAHDDWLWKDDLPGMGDVDRLARAAANLSMTRVVAKGAFTRGGEVLLVKATVGYFQGRWSLPGGYLDYGETPEACLRREVREELGVEGEVTRLLQVDSRVVESGLHFLTFLFEGELRSEAFTLKRDEIEDARWFPLRNAVHEVGRAIGNEGLRALQEERAR